jgi:hypothetical protein
MSKSMNNDDDPCISPVIAIPSPATNKGTTIERGAFCSIYTFPSFSLKLLDAEGTIRPLPSFHNQGLLFPHLVKTKS